MLSLSSFRHVILYEKTTTVISLNKMNYSYRTLDYLYCWQYFGLQVSEPGGTAKAS